jgi:hypothetical protein
VNTVSVPSDTWTEIAPGVSLLHTTGEVLQARVAPTGEVQLFRNTMPIESTAHAELDEDQEAAYRDEPTLSYKAGDVVDAGRAPL